MKANVYLSPFVSPLQVWKKYILSYVIWTFQVCIFPEEETGLIRAVFVKLRSKDTL